MIELYHSFYHTNGTFYYTPLPMRVKAFISLRVVCF